MLCEMIQGIMDWSQRLVAKGIEDHETSSLASAYSTNCRRNWVNSASLLESEALHLKR